MPEENEIISRIADCTETARGGELYLKRGCPLAFFLARKIFRPGAGRG